MSFCEHCEGQRFDRAQVLRVLRATRKSLRKHSRADEALCRAIKAVRASKFLTWNTSTSRSTSRSSTECSRTLAKMTIAAAAVVTLSFVQAGNQREYVDPGGRFRFSYPTEFG